MIEMIKNLILASVVLALISCVASASVISWEPTSGRLVTDSQGCYSAVPAGSLTKEDVNSEPNSTFPLRESTDDLMDGPFSLEVQQ